MSVSFSTNADAGKVAEQAQATSAQATQQTQGAMLGSFNSALGAASKVPIKKDEKKPDKPQGGSPAGNATNAAAAEA